MTLLQKSVYAISIFALASTQAVFAIDSTSTPRVLKAPVVTAVSSTSATFSLPENSTLTDEEKSGAYFEYYQTNQVCIMIYPTPEYCLPKKTEVGKTSITVTNLKPETSYTVTYKRDNTIRCITTPCPDNSLASETTEFKTKSAATSTPVVQPVTPHYGQIRKDLWFGHRGIDVIALQKFLIDNGYLTTYSTGYFGKLTRGAYENHHKEDSGRNENSSGRKMPTEARQASVNATGTPETFEGTITAFSTACFADGICSISVDGKTIITTRGWSKDIVGSVKGIPDLGSVEGKIGSHAKVYAAKIADGYTLYGNKDYYIDIK